MSGFSLRNVFAFAGFCDNAHDHAHKEQYVTALLAKSTPYQRQLTEVFNDLPYAQRLGDALRKTPARHLRAMIENDITIVLDNRIKTAREGFWDDAIGAILYTTPNGKILSVFDDGKSGTRDAAFHRTIRNQAVPAIKTLAELLKKKKDLPDVLIGADVHSYPPGNSCFEWQKKKEFKGTLRKTPELENPPVKLKP